MNPITIQYSQSSLILKNIPQELCDDFNLTFDPRTLEHKIPAIEYKSFLLKAREKNIQIIDNARNYNKLKLTFKHSITPREHQAKALKAWIEKERRGVVSLPTGAGKTILAVLAMEITQRSTLIIVPTIDLLHQWENTLTQFFSEKIGCLGGGKKDYQNILVATYDSARMIIESKGNNFGLLIVDECHHLPARHNRIIAESAIAPFRLGLSATVERSDGQEELLYSLLGPMAYEAKIKEMVSNVLAPYDIININAKLNDQEKQSYDLNRNIYLNFLRQKKINFSIKGAWQQFIARASQSAEGRKALSAYREQKKIPQWAADKFHKLWEIICSHTHDSMIIFTDDNSIAYKLGKELILPVLTHKTKPSERKKFLEAFRSGQLKILLTSKVLNEGVDVPEASVGVVFSGSGAVREHVQRLGRILRHTPGKRATLYEIITKDTNEKNIQERRRQHHAYQKSP